MSGIKGRSGGRNKKPVHLHVMAGTFRPDRHQSPTTGATARAIAAHAEPPAELLEGLGEPGATFLRAVFRDFDPSAAEGHIARVAAQSYDDAATARAAGDMKAARAAVRQFLAALQRLGPLATERQ